MGDCEIGLISVVSANAKITFANRHPSIYLVQFNPTEIHPFVSGFASSAKPVPTDIRS